LAVTRPKDRFQSLDSQLKLFVRVWHRCGAGSAQASLAQCAVASFLRSASSRSKT
jgi:hypothetical protein